MNAETKMGHMEGPFMKEMMDVAMEGETWVCSPMFVIRTDGDPGEPEKTRVVINMSKKGKDGLSVNNHLECKMTKWGTAAKVAEIMSTSLLYTITICNLHSFILI